MLITLKDFIVFAILVSKLIIGHLSISDFATNKPLIFDPSTMISKYDV